MVDAGRMQFANAPLFVLAFGLIASAELFRNHSASALSFVFAFGLGGLVGLVSFAVSVASGRLLRALSLTELLRRAFVPDTRAVDEAARFHARAWLRVFGLALLLIALSLLARAVSGLQDAQLARRLSLFVVLCLGLAFPIVSRPLEALFAHALAHAQSRLYEPAFNFALAATPAALAAFVFSLALYLKHGETLGALGIALFLMVGCSLTALLAVFTMRVRGRRLGRALMAVWGVSLLATFVPSRVCTRARNDLAGAFAAHKIVDGLRTLSDFDRDGHAAWLDGGDCAPFDAERHPDAREVLRDGRDSDCDGRDEPRALKAAADTYTLSPLAANLVQPFNVILMVIDSLRADHVHALGYARKTTPNLDRIAERGWLFRESHSQASATQISFPAFLTGTNPISLEWERRGHLQIAARHKTLAELLGARGYDTAFLFNGWIEEHMQGVMRGYRVREDIWPDRKAWENWRRSSAASTLGHGIHFIEQAHERAPQRPFFLTLYFEDPHAPYERYDRSDVPSFGRTARDRYDQEIAFADRHVGVLLDYLRYRPDVEKNTILIVTADHGEEFQEHGGENHGHNCNIESTHVPLIVSIPGESARISSAPVGLVDIVPTVLERVGIDPAPLKLDGRSLRWAFEAPAVEFKKRPLFCTVFDDRNAQATLLHSVRRDGLLLTHQEASSVTMLFDTRNDPAEQVDVAGDPGLSTVRKELEGLIRSRRRFGVPR